MPPAIGHEGPDSNASGHEGPASKTYMYEDCLFNNGCQRSRGTCQPEPTCVNVCSNMLHVCGQTSESNQRNDAMTGKLHAMFSPPLQAGLSIIYWSMFLRRECMPSARCKSHTCTHHSALAFVQNGKIVPVILPNQKPPRQHHGGRVHAGTGSGKKPPRQHHASDPSARAQHSFTI